MDCAAISGGTGDTATESVAECRGGAVAVLKEVNEWQPEWCVSSSVDPEPWVHDVPELRAANACQRVLEHVTDSDGLYSELARDVAEVLDRDQLLTHSNSLDMPSEVRLHREPSPDGLREQDGEACLDAEPSPAGSCEEHGEALEFEIDDLSDYLEDGRVRSSSLCSLHELDWAAVVVPPADREMGDGFFDIYEDEEDDRCPEPEPRSPGRGLTAADLEALAECSPHSCAATWAQTFLASPGAPEFDSPFAGRLLEFEIDDLSDYEDDEHARASSLCDVEHRDWSAVAPVAAAAWRDAAFSGAGEAALEPLGEGRDAAPGDGGDCMEIGPGNDECQEADLDAGDGDDQRREVELGVDGGGDEGPTPDLDVDEEGDTTSAFRATFPDLDESF